MHGHMNVRNSYRVFCRNCAVQQMLYLTLKLCRKLMYYMDTAQCLMNPLYCCCRCVQNRNRVFALVSEHTLIVQ